MTQTLHYHVLIGLDGLYMPNAVYYCATRREANECAREEARVARDNGDRVQGSAKSGGYSIGHGESIEITECDREDCSADDES